MFSTDSDGWEVMHMTLFRVRDEFISAQGVTYWDHPTHTRNNAIPIFTWSIIISSKFENVGDIIFLVASPSPPPSPPSPPSPPPHANAWTGHNFVTNTPIKFIFAIAIEVLDYKNPMIFVINRKKQNGLWRQFCIKMLKKLVGSLTLS